MAVELAKIDLPIVGRMKYFLPNWKRLTRDARVGKGLQNALYTRTSSETGFKQLPSLSIR